MIHWLWFKTDGGVGGDERMYGGWDPAVDFNDPGETNPDAVALMAQRALEPNFQAFVMYDCPCDPSVMDCHHGSDYVGTHYVADPLGVPVLTLKPLMQLKLNGVVKTSGMPFHDYAPGALVSLELEEIVPASIPDGVQIDLKHRDGFAQILQNEVAVTFTGGITNSINVTVPSQGVCGACTCIPVNLKDTMSFLAGVRGWA